MNNCDKFIKNWWSEYLDEHNTLDVLESLFEQTHNEPIQEYAEPDEVDSGAYYDVLDNMTAAEIFKAVVNGITGDDLPDTETWVLKEILEPAARNLGIDNLSFCQDFIEDMAMHISGYSTMEGFFKDLQYGGCISGMIGMLIYHSDCKRVYIEHMDDMEEFKQNLENEIGEPIKNKNRIVHADFVCWLCYEELGYQIYSYLFE